MTDSTEQLAWRETYFVLFSKDNRPTMMQVEAAIHEANPRLRVENLAADDDGLFTSGLVQAPEDNAAMEISYESGDQVIEQSIDLAKQLQEQIDDDQQAQLLSADARLDVMHFERIRETPRDESAPSKSASSEFSGDNDEELLTEALDPASLITVVEALAQLTGGLAVDPAAGEIML